MITALKHKIKAQALYFVVTISIVVAILLSGFILNASIYIEASDYLDKERKFIWNSKSALNYGLAQDILPLHKSIDLFQNGNDSVIISCSPFGMFYHMNTMVHHGNDSLISSYLIGHQSIQTDSTALYIAEPKVTLGVCGNTVIKGNLYLSKRGIERSYIEGKSYQNTKLFEGVKYVSESNLPELNLASKNAIDHVFIQSDSIREFPIDSQYLKRLAYTEYHVKGPFHLNQKIRGPVVIRSNTKITVERNADLINTILVAPHVIIEEGFSGSVQVFSTKKVVVEKNINLAFPSNIIVKVDPKELDSIGIQIGSNCSIEGNLALLQEGNSIKSKAILSVGPESIIKGEIYSTRKTELHRCKIYGSVFTQSFYLKTRSSSYNNQLLDVEIDRTKLDSNHINLGLSNTETVWKVI